MPGYKNQRVPRDRSRVLSRILYVAVSGPSAGGVPVLRPDASIIGAFGRLSCLRLWFPPRVVNLIRSGSTACAGRVMHLELARRSSFRLNTGSTPGGVFGSSCRGAGRRQAAGAGTKRRPCRLTTGTATRKRHGRLPAELCGALRRAGRRSAAPRRFVLDCRGLDIHSPNDRRENHCPGFIREPPSSLVY